MNKKIDVTLVYAIGLGLAGFSILAYLSLTTGLAAVDLSAMAGFTLLGIAVASFGFKAPGGGVASLDWMVLVSSLLIFGTFPAAWIVGLSTLICFLLPRRDIRGQGLRLTLLRASHNAGMNIVLVLLLGGLYRYLGGGIPLLGLDLRDGILIVLVALFVRLANSGFLAVIMGLSSQDWRRGFSLRAMAIDLAAASLGVFTGIAYNRVDAPTFLLFVAVLGLITFVVKWFADTRQDLERRLEELKAVNHVGHAVSSALVLDELLELIYRESHKILTFDAFMLGIYDEKARELDIRLRYDEGKRLPPATRKLGEGAMAWVVAHNQTVFVRHWSHDAGELKDIAIHIEGTRQEESLINVPISYRDRVLGVMSAQSYTPNNYTDAHVELLETFASQVAVAIANANLFEELEFRATTDDLTQLCNRRTFLQSAEAEFARSRRYLRPLSVLMIDVDHFKKINDSRGHEVGDRVLGVLADACRRSLREQDVIGRYGGEEFVALLPETSREVAQEVAERLRENIEKLTVTSPQGAFSFTLSIGVATVGTGMHHVHALIAAADDALYEAKRNGRNRVECAA